MARIKVGETFGNFSLKSHTEALIDTPALAGKKLLLSYSISNLDEGSS
jgi:hypothetical protein